MRDATSIRNELATAVSRYEDGDVVAVASWIGILEGWKRALPLEQRAPVESLTARIRQTLKAGEIDGIAEWVGAELERLIDTAPAAGPEAKPASEDLWTQHGASFVAEARNRLARAQELVLFLEENTEPESLAELFRVFHTIKGEAGFLHRNDISGIAHSTEELLDALRSGNREWDSATADLVLQGIDNLKLALNGRDQATTREEILRVPASKIDALISQIGELLTAQESDGGVQSTTVKKLGRALQQSALRLRTEPLADMMNRLKRGARDLARTLGKQVNVVLSGQSLELDRSLIASLEEPLMHLVRNSLDHGLEPEEARATAGKSSQGRLTIEALRQGNQIVISVSDDGRGLDARRIWARAVENGLVSGALPSDLGLVYALIFRPGFSTAESLSEVSGRGVGMDIVSSSVKAARGQLDVSTHSGRGTRVAMTFPLSTAVLDALVVALGDRKFLIPVHSVLESLKIDSAQLTTLATGGRVFSLRGQPLEVFSLRLALGEPDASPTWGVVTQNSQGDRQIFLVDQVESKKEVVIRTLGKLFRHLKGVSAVALLAGGSPALVLDVDQLVPLAKEAS